MEYTSRVFADFIEKLIAFDKSCRSAIDATDRDIIDREATEKNEWNQVRLSAEQKTSSYTTKCRSMLGDYQKEISDVLSYNIRDNSAQYARLQACKEALAQITAAENSIINKLSIGTGNTGSVSANSVTLTQLLNGQINFQALAYEVNAFIKNGKTKQASAKYREFYGVCSLSERLLAEEIESVRRKIASGVGELRPRYDDKGATYRQAIAREWGAQIAEVDKSAKKFALQYQFSKTDTARCVSASVRKKNETISSLVESFIATSPPKEFADEYLRIYSTEPSYAEYECAKAMPKAIYISTLEYDLATLSLCAYTKNFLKKYYPFMIRGSKMCIPYSLTFDKEFNLLFRFNGEERPHVAKNACDLGMRLFTMLPPGKVNFTFIDPVTSGDTFAMFNRLVDSDDRTREIINGQVWSKTADIESKLNTMTDHISNITQRCLQGKYPNIFEYNRVAEQNAEAYQVIMLMDFPARMSEQALKLLEQIVTTGPKCGVFTIIFRNESQFTEIPERTKLLIKNIESNFQGFDYSKNGEEILCSTNIVDGKHFMWKSIQLPTDDLLDKVILRLKKGIKSAEKVVIGIEDVNKKAETNNSTKNGIRIPIGMHGAKEVQYLSLGVGGSHHALIAGLTRMGKSSLLHTIILRAMDQYSPDELVIYLVDFKRGVEFKIYADFALPSFKVVAIETEREFGYNILVALEREQKIRADEFKRKHVDKIEEYRENYPGAKMPRVLVIMDEFHELFSNTGDDLGKKSAQIMERIVRQGAAFGVHMILASQSYTNISGIDRAVFDQMAVRILLKCSDADANLLLQGGSSEMKLISMDDPGRAIYNSEAGNPQFNNHFRVGYIDPKKHWNMLQEISDKYSGYIDKKRPTRILLSNIEDNQYSIYSQFANYSVEDYNTPGRLYIGESLSLVNNLDLDITRTGYSNLLMVGEDSEKARSMFAFSMLSLAINYWITHGKSAPEEPFIYLINYKPLDDDYFIDAPAILATELLPAYVKNIPIYDPEGIKEVVRDFYEIVEKKKVGSADQDKYLFVFGLQRAEELLSTEKGIQQRDILSMMSAKQSVSNNYSMKEMLEFILTQGAQNGVHAIFWQDNFKALDDANRKMITYFYNRIAFDMSKEEFSQFVGVNDISQLSENNAVYSNRTGVKNFRPYQSPDRAWLENICDKLR